MTFDFTTQMTISHLLTPMPINKKKLSAKTTKYIPKCCERSVKRKSYLNFIRVIKNSSFDQHFVLYSDMYGPNLSENYLVMIACSPRRTSSH